MQLPTDSGPVYSVSALPNGQHLLAGSNDAFRMWDLTNSADSPSGPFDLENPNQKFVIVHGHRGGCISSTLINGENLVTASGNRGWGGNVSNLCIIYDIKGC